MVEGAGECKVNGRLLTLEGVVAQGEGLLESNQLCDLGHVTSPS